MYDEIFEIIRKIITILLPLALGIFYSKIFLKVRLEILNMDKINIINKNDNIKKELSNYFIDDLSKIILSYCRFTDGHDFLTKHKIDDHEIENQIDKLYHYNHNDKIYDGKILYLSSFQHDSLKLIEYDLLHQKRKIISFENIKFKKSSILRKNIIIKDNKNIYIVSDYDIFEIDSKNCVNNIKINIVPYIPLYQCVKNIRNNIIYIDNDCCDYFITYNNEPNNKYKIKKLFFFVNLITENSYFSTYYYNFLSKRFNYKLYSNNNELICIRHLSDTKECNCFPARNLHIGAILYIFDYENLSFLKQKFYIGFDTPTHRELTVLFFDNFEIIYVIKKKVKNCWSYYFFSLDRSNSKTTNIAYTNWNMNFVLVNNSIIKISFRKR